MENETNQPWYHAGLRFHCSQCGHCCTGAPGYVWVNDEEIAALANFLREPVEQTIEIHTRLAHRGRTLREKANGDCIFYDKTVGCTIYPVRPRQCRTWPFWASNIESPQTWEHTCKICPGSGEGELIPSEEIVKRLNVIRI